ncbi:MAG: MEDS domain-containing protein, partial [Candidatus Omnitrophica bacterium]|nr:MEDS domain-containing protein [Candidatus Omnitrophota bacterium]
MHNTGIRSGIDFIGTCAWGTHLCLLYRTKQEFLEISVPFLKAGLENNELCIWLTGRDLPARDVKRLLKNLIPQFDSFLQTGNLEIHDGRTWCSQDN